MPKIRCPFCHELVESTLFSAHQAEHRKLRPDGQQTEYATLPPEARSAGSLTGVPRIYEHAKCGARTGMPEEIIRSYLKNPFMYSNKTYCCGCQAHVPHGECTWVETGQNLQVYMDELRRAVESTSTSATYTTKNASPQSASSWLRRLFGNR